MPNYNYKGRQYPVHRDLEFCPSCHRSIQPIVVYQAENKAKNRVMVFMTCPNGQCQQGFVTMYQLDATKAVLNFDRVFNTIPIEKGFEKRIETVSPSFEKIYNQASHAEQVGLDEIAGLGYRKALEFLIKDFVSSLQTEEEIIENIKRIALGKCINDYVPDPRIIKVAKRVAWLGNDHAHYVKKWVTKDLKDLKILLELTVHWVDAELLTQELDVDMPQS